MRLKVVKTLWFLVTAVVRQTPVDLPELEMAVLAGCGKDSTVRREGDIMDDLWGRESGRERESSFLAIFTESKYSTINTCISDHTWKSTVIRENFIIKNISFCVK